MTYSSCITKIELNFSKGSKRNIVVVIITKDNIQAQLTASSNFKYITVNQSKIVMHFCEAVFVIGY